ncbi:hypothetical protein [Streptomyces sp. NPDC048002]|uniref:hypothetical protein n=1 Tax=Streptomyces sp. NPDC048002 TaxID=3154344 RepID=UPI0033F8512D
MTALQLQVRDPGTEFAGLPPLGGITALTLPGLDGDADLAGLTTTFPALKRVVLGPVPEHSTPDLTPLHALPWLSVTLAADGQPPRLKGHEVLGGRLRFTTTATLYLR